MRVSIYSLLVAVVPSAAAAPHVASKGLSPTIQERAASLAPFSTFAHNPVYMPAQDAPLWRVAYARALQLRDQSLILTWEDYPYGESSTNLDTFVVLRSTDGGVSWSNYSQVHDTQNGWGMRFQPQLYTLTSSVGAYPAGTILAAGVSTPLSLQGGVYIDIYTSMDSGKTWAFASHVAYGNGPEVVTTGDAAIWEPFLLQYQGKLVLYFSDQRDPAHSQKLSMTYTTDLKTWSASSDVVSHSDPNARPGMAVVSYLPQTQQYILTYEFCNSPSGSGCPATYRLSSDPTAFDSATDNTITLANGYVPGGSPYTVYIPSTQSLVASTNSDTNLFVSKDNAKTWVSVDKGQYTGQSRHLLLFDDNGTQRLHYATGGFYGCSGSCYNYVANGVSDFSGF